MAGVSNNSQEGPLAAINVTPLVDVMLVLLAIFMITARLEQEHSVPLDLPKAASGEAIQQILNITLDHTGVRTVDGTPAPDDESLRALARAALQRQPDVRTIIQAASGAQHGEVIRILDTLRLAGISKVAFAVEPTR